MEGTESIQNLIRKTREDGRNCIPNLWNLNTSHRIIRYIPNVNVNSFRMLGVFFSIFAAYIFSIPSHVLNLLKV